MREQIVERFVPTMRVTAGRLRGRALAAPADVRVRPTSDRVRQAIFNILAHADFGTDFTLVGARVIDLFAGTGAMGVEALSRGASFCLFVDSAAESRAIIRENVESYSLTGETKIWRRDATALGPISTGSGGPFSLGFVDPPYRRSLVGPALMSLRDGGWLLRHALVVAEFATDEQLGVVADFGLVDERCYDETRIAFLKFDPG